MKLFKHLFCIVLTAGLMASCDSITDIQQPGILNPEATFSSVDDLEGGLLGAYAQLDITPQIFWNQAFTDQISIGEENGGQALSGAYVFNLNTTTGGATAIWTNNYDAINATTRLIEAAADVTPGEEEKDDYDAIIGQAHAIRAYAHFQLMTYYSADMSDDGSLGVIAVEEIPNINDARPRNTTGEVFDLINRDLDQAESLIPSSLSDETRITQDAITAIRARMATYRQNYGAAEQFSQQLIDSYDLATQQEYVDMFRLDTQGEVIFKLERTIGDLYDGQGANGGSAAGGWAGSTFSFTGPDVGEGLYFEVSRSLFSVLDSPDVRLPIIAGPTAVLNPNYPDVDISSFRNTSLIPINKYRGNVPGENQPLMNDLKVFRVSEMYLINAEAKAAQGDLPGAASKIKELRDARYDNDQPLPSYANAQEAFGDILDERRVELAFEGFRYIDLGRLGERGNRGIDRAIADCQPYGGCDAPAVTSNLFRFPIPQVELNGNNAIQQNPGYAGSNNGEGEEGS